MFSLLLLSSFERKVLKPPERDLGNGLMALPPAIERGEERLHLPTVMSIDR